MVPWTKMDSIRKKWMHRQQSNQQASSILFPFLVYPSHLREAYAVSVAIIFVCGLVSLEAKYLCVKPQLTLPTFVRQESQPIGLRRNFNSLQKQTCHCPCTAEFYLVSPQQNLATRSIIHETLFCLVERSNYSHSLQHTIYTHPQTAAPKECWKFCWSRTRARRYGPRCLPFRTAQHVSVQ